MAVLAGIHADAQEHSARCGANARSAGEQSLLTDATVASADTNAGLQAAVLAASGHADVEPARYRINGAIDYMAQSGEWSDARVLSDTTITELIAQTYNDDTRREEMPV